MIRFDGIAKTFRGRDGTVVEALGGVSLDVGAGEFVAIVGASGCGESTLLRLAAGLVAPSTGEVTLDGSRVTGPRAETAMVFQAATLLPWANVLRNVTFPLRLMGKGAVETEGKARALLATAGLGYLIQTSMAFFRRPLAFSTVVILAIMGILLFQAVSLAERILFRWSSGSEHSAPPAA